MQSRSGLSGFNECILAVSPDFKSLTNMSSGICQNEYPPNENATVAEEKKKRKKLSKVKG